MKILVLAIIGSMVPLASAEASITIGNSRSAEFATSMVVGEEAAGFDKGGVRLFSKGGKGSKTGKSAKDSKSTSEKESQTLFSKSGKSKSHKTKTAAKTPHKLFPKSKKGNSAKAGKSGAIGPFHKAGKSKSSKGNIYHHQSDHLPATIIDDNENEVDNNVNNDAENGTMNGLLGDTSDADETTDGINNEPSLILSPTPQPTCKSDIVTKDFNLCIAIDGSGSVCNSGMQMNCIGCGLYCQDMGVDQDTCCRNFDNVKGFSSLMVSSLDDFPADKSFSVVQFGSEITVESELTSATQILLTLDEMKYAGGYTDHSSAIQACEQTLFSAHRNGKKIILLITDGVSTWPENDPEGTAERAAIMAEEDGISIIPIFISAEHDEGAHAFMKRLSSDGKVFDVTDFESLNSLQESLVNQVSCS